MNFLKSICLLFVTYLPGPAGYSLRYRYWRKRLKILGRNVLIDTGVYFQNPSFIELEDNCWIDKDVIILAGLDDSQREKVVLKNRDYKGAPGIVHIGRNVHIAPRCILSGISGGIFISDDCGFSADCKVYAFTHHYRSRKDPKNTQFHFGPMASQERQCLVQGPVYLAENTGVALHSIILPGVAILRNSFVAVNSVINPGRYAENSLLSGNPAHRIGDRFTSDE